MADFPQNSNGNSGLESTPPLKVGVRTMNSDVESFKQNGGVATNPTMANIPVSNFENASEASIDASPQFESTDFQADFNAPQLGASSSLPIPESEGSGSRKKVILTILAVIVLALACGLLGYYIVFPILFPDDSEISTTPTVSETSETAKTPVVTETPASTHESFLILPAEQTDSVDLATIDSVSLTGALSRFVSLQLPKDSLREVVLVGPGGVQVSLSSYLTTLLPDLKTDDVETYFDKDFTNLLYYNTDGVWPVIVGKLKDGAILATAQTMTSELEDLNSLSGLYLENPGVATAAGFKNGQVSGKAGRYLAFSKKGASLNYVWLGEFFVISTNYDGAREVARRLGF